MVFPDDVDGARMKNPANPSRIHTLVKKLLFYFGWEPRKPIYRPEAHITLPPPGEPMRNRIEVFLG